jgi:hypothetical protein
VTSIRRLKLTHDAGEADDVLALRIDVVGAATAWAHSLTGDEVAIVAAEGRLYRAVRRYEGAVRRRKLT